MLGHGHQHRVRRAGKVPTGRRPGAEPARQHRHRPHPLGDPRRTDRRNAHPHIAGDEIAIVHNGIIENHEAMRRELEGAGYSSPPRPTPKSWSTRSTATPPPASSLTDAVRATVRELDGAYALGVISTKEPGRMVAARSGSPLVIGVGIGEHFIASDVFALLPVTQQFIFLEEGDMAVLERDKLTIYDAEGKAVERPVRRSELSADAADRGAYRHFMLKEIHEQPRAVSETLEGRLGKGRVLPEAFGPDAAELFDRVRRVQIIACGTSYHAGVVASYWFESLAGLPCDVDVASEFRYRKPVVAPDTLFVTISQSGETADTLAALREAKKQGFGASLAMCNVPESSLVRESDLVLMTRAGPEIGVASTKAFTTQLIALMLLVIALGRRHGLTAEREAELVTALTGLPRKLEEALGMEAEIEELAETFVDKRHTLFLGRGSQFPIAMEGALEAQGNLLHPRRSLPRRRTQARPAGPGGFGNARGRHGPPQRPPGKTQIQPPGSPRPRRRTDRLRRQSRRHERRPGITDFHRARGGRGPGAHRLHRPPAAAGLPRRRLQGHRRRPAPQPGKIRNGRIARQRPNQNRRRVGAAHADPIC